jgi:hypothetical protein
VLNRMCCCCCLRCKPPITTCSHPTALPPAIHFPLIL